jgi:hypothetical protein
MFEIYHHGYFFFGIILPFVVLACDRVPGVTPCVAVQKGVVIVVYKKVDSDALLYKAGMSLLPPPSSLLPPLSSLLPPPSLSLTLPGCLLENDVQWFDESVYATGTNPNLAFNSSGQVIATHVDDKKQRSWIVGKFDFQTYVITWGVPTAYGFFFGILGRRRRGGQRGE